MKRGFEVVSSFADKEISIPTRKTKYSAGYDIAIAEDVLIPSGKVVICKTGVKAFMEDDEVLYIYPRSSLSFGKVVKLKDGTSQQIYLTLANNVGVIDKDFYNNPDNEGHIGLIMYNFGDNDVLLEKGMLVAQGIFQKYLVASNESQVQEERIGGFGSTDRAS